MTNKKKSSIILAAALIQLALAVAVMAYGAFTKNISNFQGNLIMGAALAIYWGLSDVAEPFAVGRVQKLSQERKAAYWKYVLLDFVGLAGIAVFLFSIGTASNYGFWGAVAFALTMKPKRDFQDIYYGTKKPEAEKEPETDCVPERDGESGAHMEKSLE